MFSLVDGYCALCGAYELEAWVRTAPDLPRDWWRSATVDGRPVSELLRTRDIGALFRFLRTRGWSRLAIAAATGLTETRVRAVAQGRQRITSYDVLERVADGFSLDRGLMGLAYTPPRPPGAAGYDANVKSGHRTPPMVIDLTTEDTATMPGPSGPMASRSWPEFGDSLEVAASADAKWEDPMQRRNLMAMLAGVAVGSVTAPEVAPWLPALRQPMSVADKVTSQHVALVRKVTELHRVTDLRAGGGAVPSLSRSDETPGSLIF